MLSRHKEILEKFLRIRDRKFHSLEIWEITYTIEMNFIQFCLFLENKKRKRIGFHLIYVIFVIFVLFRNYSSWKVKSYEIIGKLENYKSFKTEMKNKTGSKGMAE